MRARTALSSACLCAVVGVIGCGSDLGTTEQTARTRVEPLVGSDNAGCPRQVPHADTVGVRLTESLMAQYPAYMSYETSVVKKGWEYTNGVLLFAIEKLFALTRDSRYLEYVRPYVDRYVQLDGTILYLQGNPNLTRDPRILDVIQPSTLLFPLYEADPGSTQYLAAMKNTRDIYPTIQTNSLGGFFHKPTYPYQMWLDGLYMAEPFLARFGTEHADGFDATGADQRACLDTVAHQLLLIADKTEVPGKNLYCHAWLDWAGITAYNAANTPGYAIPAWADPVTGQSPEVWSRALGWYAMALVDVLESLPPQHPEHKQIVAILRNLAVGLERYQDADTGLWYQVVDKGGQPGNFLETSGSAMFVYALATASRSGAIEGRYHKVAEKGWEGVVSRVVFDPNGSFRVRGTVGGMGVLNNYAAYVAVPQVDNSPQGIAAVVLASSAMEFNPQGCEVGR